MTDVLIKLRTARGKQIEILHSLVVGEVGEELLLELDQSPPEMTATFMTPNKSCKRTATSAPRATCLGERPSRSNTKSFLMMFLLVGLLDEASASTNSSSTLYHPKRVEITSHGPSRTHRSCHGEHSGINRLNESSGLLRTVWSMKQFAKPIVRRFEKPALDGTRASWGHATRRVALILVALGVACSAFHRRMPSLLLRPRRRWRPPLCPRHAYALVCWTHSRYRRGARGSFTPYATRSLRPGGPGTRCPTTHHLYLLPMSVSVDQYVGPLAEREKVGGTGTTSRPITNPVYSMTVYRTCVSAHITYCVSRT